MRIKYGVFELRLESTAVVEDAGIILLGFVDQLVPVSVEYSMSEPKAPAAFHRRFIVVNPGIIA